jgi:hypothetical protein
MNSSNPTDGFDKLLASVGDRPPVADQHVTRHYSETLSKALAHWIRDRLIGDPRIHTVLSPEGRVPTCFGRKSLDVGCLDSSGYLALDISIKTFSFRDRATGRYTHNFTGRFYELLGEGLDLRLSYPEAVLVAMVFLPMDSCGDATDRAASSFGSLVKQFSKIAARGGDGDHALSFEHVFVGLYDAKDVSFFDASTAPPRDGVPPKADLLTCRELLSLVLESVGRRAAVRDPRKMNTESAFRWASEA